MSRGALLIGNTIHEKNKLYAPEADIWAFAEMLKNECNFQIAGILINKTHAEVCWIIERFYQQAKREDLTLLYFSGHAEKCSYSGEPYLVVSNTDNKHPGATGINELFLYSIIRNSNAQHHIVILDCCNSGAFIQKSNIPSKGTSFSGSLRGITTAILTSSSGSQPSYAGPGSYSRFTRYLIKGVKTGKADQNHDNIISIYEFFNYAKRHVQAHNRNQIPGLVLNIAADNIHIAKLAKSNHSNNLMYYIVVLVVLLLLFFCALNRLGSQL